MGKLKLVLSWMSVKIRKNLLLEVAQRIAMGGKSRGEVRGESG